MFWRQQRKTATRKLVSVSRPFTSPFSYSGRKVPNIEESSMDVCHRFERIGVRLKSKKTIFFALLTGKVALKISKTKRNLKN